MRIHLQLQLLRGYGDSVEVTESHGLLQLGVVARWTDECKAIFQLSPGHLRMNVSIRKPECASGTQQVNMLAKSAHLLTELNNGAHSGSDGRKFVFHG